MADINLTKKYVIKSVLSPGNLGEATSKTTFILAAKDFLDGKINKKDFQDICIHLYYDLNKPFEIDTTWDNNLSFLLHRCTDLAHISEKAYEVIIRDLSNFIE